MVRLCDMPEYRDIKNVNPFSSGGKETAEQAKNHFAKNFTSAAILKAKDGVNWTTQMQTEEQKKDAEEASKRRDLVGDGTQTTLYDQLEANKAKMQEEFDENTKKLFAPGKALDEEDVQFFDEQRATMLEKERKKKEKDLEGLLDFKTAQDRRVVKAVQHVAPAVEWGATAAKSSPGAPAGAGPKGGVAAGAVPLVVVRKRKTAHDGGGGGADPEGGDDDKAVAKKKKKKKKHHKKDKKQKKQEKKKEQGAAATATEATKGGAALGAGLAMYGSSSDDDE